MAAGDGIGDNGRNVQQRKYVNNDSFLDEWFITDRELFLSRANNFFDKGYSVFWGESDSVSAMNINSYLTAVSNRFYEVLGLKIYFEPAVYYQSPIDTCKNTTTAGNLNTLCTHSGTKHTDVDNVILSFNGSHTGNNRVTNVYWSDHLIRCNYGTNTVDYNRSCSSGTSIFMIGRSSSGDRSLSSKGVLMHELAHQYGANDHYHELLTGGGCRGGDACDTCGNNPRPTSCIMNVSRIDITNSDVLCDACRLDILSHLKAHHTTLQ